MILTGRGDSAFEIPGDGEASIFIVRIEDLS